MIIIGKEQQESRIGYAIHAYLHMAITWHARAANISQYAAFFLDGGVMPWDPSAGARGEPFQPLTAHSPAPALATRRQATVLTVRHSTAARGPL